MKVEHCTEKLKPKNILIAPLILDTYVKSEDKDQSAALSTSQELKQASKSWLSSFSAVPKWSSFHCLPQGGAAVSSISQRESAVWWLAFMYLTPAA